MFFKVIHGALLVLSLASAPGAALGQVPEQTEPARGTDTSGGAASPVDVDQLIREALANLDELERVEDPAMRSRLLEEVLDRARVVQESDPDNPWAKYVFGRAYLISGRAGDAIDYMQRFVRTREGRNEWRAHRLLGDMFVGKFPRLAQASYQRAIALKPGEPALLHGLSVCAAKTGDLDEAIRLAEEAVLADGRRTIAYQHHYARTLASRGRLAEARHVALAVLALAEKAAREQRGEREPLEVLDKQHQLVIDVIDGLIRDDPGHAENYVEIVKYLRARSANSIEIARFDVLDILEAGVTEARPDRAPRLMVEYGRTLAAVGRLEQAMAVLKDVLAADPQNSEARKALAELQGGEPVGD